LRSFDLLEHVGKRGVEFRLAGRNQLRERRVRSGCDRRFNGSAGRCSGVRAVRLVFASNAVQGVVDRRVDDGEDARLAQRVELLRGGRVGRDAVPALDLARARLRRREKERQAKRYGCSVFHCRLPVDLEQAG